MASALDELSQNTTAENPASFQEFYYNWKKDNGYADFYLPGMKVNSSALTGEDLMSKINNFFTGQVTSAKSAYNNYLTGLQNKWTAGREDTAIQRQMADAKAAGLNPLALLSGNAPSGASSSAAAEFSKSSGSKSSKASNLVTSALKLLAILALKG